MENAIRLHIPQIVGQTPRIKEIRKRIEKISASDVPVLITGEPGTGKDLIAQTIHYHSSRSNDPLVKIDFCPLTENLSSGDILKYQERVLLETKKDKRFAIASNGTFFLDKIEMLSPLLQTEFCRLLEGNPSENLKGLWSKIKNMRLVFAATTTLNKKNRGTILKEFLLDRVKAIHLDLPPLRERKADIPLFVRSTANFQDENGNLQVPAEILNLFSGYQWPGNVRELLDVIHRARVTGRWKLVPEAYT